MEPSVRQSVASDRAIYCEWRDQVISVDDCADCCHLLLASPVEAPREIVCERMPSWCRRPTGLAG